MYFFFGIAFCLLINKIGQINLKLQKERLELSEDYPLKITRLPISSLLRYKNKSLISKNNGNVTLTDGKCRTRTYTIKNGLKFSKLTS